MPNELESILSGQPGVAPDSQPPVETKAEAPSPEQRTETQSEPPEEQGGNGMVPVAALQAERGKVKRYTEQVADFEKRLSEQNAQWENRFNQMMQAFQPRQPPEQAAIPDIWDKPDEFVDHRAMQHVAPIRQQAMALARQIAEVQFQPDAVKAAEEAFNQAVVTKTLDPEIFNKIQGSPNPFAAAVQWHREAAAKAEIGSDPAAWQAKKEAEIRERLMAEFQSGNAPSAQPAQVLPSNFATARNVGSRAGPAWAGPAPIQDIFARRK